MLNTITPLILTFNEEANIRRTLDALNWASQVVVIDSLSTDATKTICAEYSKVRFIQREFDQHAAQWNFGLTQLDEHGWTLALDADHIVSAEFVAEVQRYFSSATGVPSEVCGFRNEFIYCQDGKPLKGSLYPPLTALYRTSHGHYIQEGHTQRLQLSGNIVALKSRNYHDDRKPISRWLKAQQKYANLDAAKLSQQPFSQLRWTDRARLVPFLSPLLVLIYTLFIKGLALGGSAGLKYSLQRVYAECLLHRARVRRWFYG